ncbi:hypothetical protein [Methanobrevibacter arboriphilus]|uniref:hypothetical protein n=1 Tax=Methanobrevibacter arboriphilus TaxID=39441 RepID=UPI000A8F9ED7|nr:hypothetical protein [Methanobrevibacter arboriphilus]
MCLNNDYVDLDNSYGYVLATILHKFGEKFDEALKDYSIVTNHYRVLVTIFNNEKNQSKKIRRNFKD